MRSPAILASARGCKCGTERGPYIHIYYHYYSILLYYLTLCHRGLGWVGLIKRVCFLFACSDTTLAPQNFNEQVKQWTTVFGYSSTPVSNATSPGLPSNYYNATFGPKFQAILAQGVGHTVPLYEQQYLQFLGIA